MTLSQRIQTASAKTLAAVFGVSVQRIVAIVRHPTPPAPVFGE